MYKVESKMKSDNEMSTQNKIKLLQKENNSLKTIIKTVTLIVIYNYNVQYEKELKHQKSIIDELLNKLRKFSRENNASYKE